MIATTNSKTTKSKTTTPVRTKPVPQEPEGVSCDICLDEIPQSVAHSQEADEYAQHYCGLECYEQWRGISNKPESA